MWYADDTALIVETNKAIATSRTIKAYSYSHSFVFFVGSHRNLFGRLKKKLKFEFYFFSTFTKITLAAFVNQFIKKKWPKQNDNIFVYIFVVFRKIKSMNISQKTKPTYLAWIDSYQMTYTISLWKLEYPVQLIRKIPAKFSLFFQCRPKRLSQKQCTQVRLHPMKFTETIVEICNRNNSIISVFSECIGQETTVINTNNIESSPILNYVNVHSFCFPILF